MSKTIQIHKNEDLEVSYNNLNNSLSKLKSNDLDGDLTRKQKNKIYKILNNNN